ncbi:MAG TPA: XdhC family protein [Steroidobacteraceae bacterium]|nr:XdhC family protein [Steroidobacteraceae bacterium]
MIETDPFATHHRRILGELADLAARRVAFTLCVVVHCSGSTYRKAGALALVEADGSRLGVISGGCLESDLESAARAALAENRPRVALFDTRSDDDLVFGSGSGCRGQMQLLLLPVAAGATHPLCAALLAAERAQQPLKAAFVTSGPHVGSGFLWSGSAEIELAPQLEPARALKASPVGEHRLADGLTCAVVLFSPSPCILLIGAGPEAPALVGIAGQLGWRVIVADHREALLTKHAACAERTLCARPAAALAALGDQRLDACIVMTHTASNDREALAALARRAEPFVGLLGPRARRDELLAELDPGARAALAPRLHAPVGIRLGGQGPEMLALSICAELQRFLAERSERRSPA